MNSIALVPTIGRGALFIEDHEWGRVDHLDIQVDGKPLSNWLDELGPPIFMTPLGWGASRGKAHSYDVAQLLGEQPPDLESGRVPVLNYEGEYRGMVYSVRILVDGDQVRWTDWAYGGFDDQRPLVELNDLTDPGDFVFDRQTYEAVFQAVRETPPKPSACKSRNGGTPLAFESRRPPPSAWSSVSSL